MFVVGTLLLGNAWAVVDAKFAVVDAARAGARAYVQADDQIIAETTATRAERAAMAGHHRSHDAVSYPEPVVRPRFERCARVEVTVRDLVPAVELPFVGGVGHGFSVVGVQRELIDPYRSGPAAGSACAG